MLLRLLLPFLLRSSSAVTPTGVRIANDWVTNFNTVIIDARLPNQVANRYLAYVSVAVCETYNFIRTAKNTANPVKPAIGKWLYPTTAPYNYTIDVVRAGVDEDIAASAAAHYLL